MFSGGNQGFISSVSRKQQPSNFEDGGESNCGNDRISVCIEQANVEKIVRGTEHDDNNTSTVEEQERREATKVVCNKVRVRLQTL